MSLSSIPAISKPPIIEPAETHGSTFSGGGFQQVLQAAIQDVGASSQAADTAIQGFLSGQTQELHSTILATQNAELDFDMFLQVRNKVVSAYEEIMKMQV